MLEKDIYPQIAAELKVQPHQVEAAAKLLDEAAEQPAYETAETTKAAATSTARRL